MSRPRKRIVPPTMRAGSSSRRMIDLRGDALAGAGFADDAERLAGHAASKLTPSTARTTPASVKNQVRRSLDLARQSAQRRRACGSSQSRMPSPTKLKPITTVRIARPGKGRDPPLLHQLAPFRHHRAPFRRRRHHAEAEERQAGEHQDGVAEVERDQHDQRPDGVGHDLAEQDVRRAEADRPAPPRRIPASAGRSPGCARGGRISATTPPAWR